MIFRNTSHASEICKKSRGAFWKKSAPASARHPDADFLRRNSPQMKTKPRVLLLSATSGAGHVRAAQALEKAFLARGNCAVEHIDALQYVSRLFQRVYDKAYISMVRRAPELMGVLYERTDQPWLHPRRRLALDRLNTGPMIRLLKRIQPDLCVATHFLPAEIIAWLIAKRQVRRDFAPPGSPRRWTSTWRQQI